jgi:hypothetical protein
MENILAEGDGFFNTPICAPFNDFDFFTSCIYACLLAN